MDIVKKEIKYTFISSPGSIKEKEDRILVTSEAESVGYLIGSEAVTSTKKKEIFIRKVVLANNYIN